MVKFGRVCTHAGHRKYGVGKQLINKTMEFIKNNTEAKSIKIAAQSYLVEFYKQFGFKPISESYLTEDGIEHTDMKALI
jgi:ElaA protein